MVAPAVSQAATADPKCISASIPKSQQKFSRYHILAQGDRCYRQGNEVAAKQWYRLVKAPFTTSEKADSAAEAIYEPDKLSIQGKVFWRNYESTKSQEAVSGGSMVPLYLLLKSDPNFVPGYTALLDMFKKSPNWCKEKGNVSTCEGNPRNVAETLEQVTSMFPNDPSLTKAKIDALAESGDYLGASIAARQFSLFFPDNPDVAQFTQLADKYMKQYRDDLKKDLILKTVLGCGLSIVFSEGGASGCTIAGMLIAGESRFGESAAEQQKQKLTLVDDPIVTEYVKGIGDRLTPLMGRSDFKYEYYVVRDDAMNAFALPGGKVFVNTGAILAADSEAELAGLLGHEIAHAVFSHGYQKVAWLTDKSLRQRAGTLWRMGIDKVEGELAFWNQKPLINQNA